MTSAAARLCSPVPILQLHNLLVAHRAQVYARHNWRPNTASLISNPLPVIHPQLSYSMSRERSLKIQVMPFKSSNLAIPPSPFSPREPITPQFAASSALTPPVIKRRLVTSVSAPAPPLQWLWQCHICHNTYPLGITRRCLEDGHHFCAGTTTVKSWRRGVAKQKVLRRHKACASEFDYQGWKNWGAWRRNEQRLATGNSVESESSKDSDSIDSDSSDEFASRMAVDHEPSHDPQHKDCWNHCDYPSECRWGKQFGVQTPVLASTTFVVQQPSPPSPNKEAKTATPPTTFDGILAGNHETEEPPQTKAAKDDFWSSLLTSASRRRSSQNLAGLNSSPLASNPVDTPSSDVDVEMEDIAIPAPSRSPSPKSATREGINTQQYAPVSLRDVVATIELGNAKKSDKGKGKPLAEPEPLHLPSPTTAAQFDFGFAGEVERIRSRSPSPEKGKGKGKMKVASVWRKSRNDSMF